MKAGAAVVLLLVVTTVTAKSLPDKRFISIHDIQQGLHHLGHEIEHGVQHIGHQIESGVQHIGHQIENGVQSIGHEMEHGVQHLGHEIEHGVEHLGSELAHLTGIHSPKDLACRIYPHVRGSGETACDVKCVAMVTATTAVYLSPLCAPACHLVFTEMDDLVDC